MPTIWKRRLTPKVATAFEATASLAALALGTPIPIGTIARLMMAVGATEPALKEWEERLIAAVRAWLAANTTVGSDLLEGWEDRLVKSFNDAGAATFVAASPHARDTTVELVARAVFVPYTSLEWDRSRESARALLNALPDLVLESAGDFGEFAALRTVLGGQLTRVLEALDDLGDRIPPRAADDTALAAYLGGLRAVLDVDPWAGLIGGPARTLETGFVPRRVRFGTEAASIHEVVDGCDRLVVLGEPGSGKSWVARHLAIRAADQALVRLARTSSNAATDRVEAGVTDEIELPLVANASTILDAADGTSPWDVLTQASIGALGEHLGPEGVAALRSRLGRRYGAYLVILDGLDEAVRHADATTLDRLLRTPGPVVRVALTSRTAVWRGVQLPLNAARNWIGKMPEGRGHAVVEVEPFDDAEVRDAIADLLAASPTAHVALTARLEADERLATFARYPLACVMLSAMVAGTGEVPRGRTMLYTGIVSLLLRSSWRREFSDEVVHEARAALRQLAITGVEDDPSTSLGRMHDLVTFPPSLVLSTETAKSVDAVAPVATFDAASPVQRRRFIHASLQTHMLGEHVAALDAPAAAAQLRHHLWFDSEWQDAIPAALALHAQRTTVLRALLDVTPDRPLAWSDVLRLDGFGELRRLLIELARESQASEWDEDCRRVIVKAAHAELAAWPQSSLRLELVRGGWPDDLSRDEHLARIRSGQPSWPVRDIGAGIGSLALDHVTRRELASTLTAGLDTPTPSDLETTAALLDALCDDELADERRRAAMKLVGLVRAAPVAERIAALLTLQPSAEEAQAAAEGIVDWLERADVDEWTVYTIGEAGAYVTELTAAEQLTKRGASALVAALERFRTPTELNAAGRGTSLIRSDAAASARAIQHVLLALEGCDSYDVGRLTLLLDRLRPSPADAHTVLSTLLEEPASIWPRWDVAVDLLADVADELEPAVARALLSDLVARLAADELRDLDRLADFVERLDPAPPMRQEAARVLLARLRETPREVILSCALVLRRFATPDIESAAAEILHEHLVDETDRQFRFSLADGVLWFARDGLARSDAVDEAVGGIDVVTSLGFYHLKHWFAESATPDERVRFFDALASAFQREEPALSRVAVPSDLLAFTVPKENRRKAATALLDRLRRDPAKYPSDWLPLAATFGAPRDELEEANALVVDALLEMDLDGGSCFALGWMWANVELTPDQRDRAAHLLLQRLEDVPASSVSAVVQLMREIGASSAYEEAAFERLRARLELEDELLRGGIERALDMLRPAADEPLAAADLLPELERELTGATADKFEAAELTEDERQRAIRTLVERAVRDAVEWYGVDSLDRIADALAITPADLEPAFEGPPPTGQAMRRLARSARSRCDGEEWRAFLHRVAE